MTNTDQNPRLFSTQDTTWQTPAKQIAEDHKADLFGSEEEKGFNEPEAFEPPRLYNFLKNWIEISMLNIWLNYFRTNFVLVY